MPIYAARPRLSDTEKRILRILAEALVELPDDRTGSNIPPERVPLTDEGASELLSLLEQYVASKRFQERARFIEVVGGTGASRVAREIYLRGRTDAGRTRAAASWQWGSFQLRLGRGHDVARGSTGSYMDIGHFMKMEDRLFRELQLHPRVRSLLLQMIADRRRDVEAVRKGEKKLPPGSISRVPEPVIEELGAAKAGDGDHTLPLRKVVALTTLTADLSVLFTTRDWGVAGTLSAMAAVPPALFT